MPDKLDIGLDAVQAQAQAGDPAALAFLAGRLVMSVQSKRTGEHITVRATAKVKAGGWKRCSFDAATHVFMDVPRPDGEFADKVGTYYPGGKYAGQLWSDTRADPARVWTAKLVLRIAAGLAPWETDQYEVLQNTHCLYCGRELTDPVSIRRQIGPECAKTVGGGMHQTKQRAPKAEDAEARAEAERIDAEGKLEAIDALRDLEAGQPEREGLHGTPTLATLRSGESAQAAYAAMLAQENAAEVAEGQET